METVNDEAKCNCQNCDEAIAFPSEMAGQTVACPHCQCETLLTIKQPSQSEQSDEILSVSKHPEYHLHKEIQLGDASYIIYLEPSEVRHLQAHNFVKYEAEDWIEYFKRQSLTPEIHGPYGREEEEGIEAVITVEFIKEPTWEDNFRILHSFAMLRRDFGVSYTIYKFFHDFLKLQSLEFAECVNSWVKEAWENYFIAQSYSKSHQHLLVKFGDELNEPEKIRFAVFKKTPFVIQRLEELQKAEETAKTAENLEVLRRSNFKIFVYLMEDLRNGLFKIGQSQTPEKRENTLQSEVPEISVRFYLPAPDTAEKELHEMFDSKRIRGEWFQLTPQDILSIIGILKQKGDLNRAFADYEWLGKITLRV